MQYADAASAANAKAALEGHAIYDGGYNRVCVSSAAATSSQCFVPCTSRCRLSLNHVSVSRKSHNPFFRSLLLQMCPCGNGADGR